MPWRLENLAERHREVNIVVGDAFSSYDRASWMVRLHRVHPNLWFDTAAMAGMNDLLMQFVRSVGHERVLFGSNLYPVPDREFHPIALTVLRSSRIIGDTARTAILSGNALQLFGLNSPAAVHAE
jgi:predicted TIM-barrel fold metal-dependent hydrolase